MVSNISKRKTHKQPHSCLTTQFSRMSVTYSILPQRLYHGYEPPSSPTNKPVVSPVDVEIPPFTKPQDCQSQSSYPTSPVGTNKPSPRASLQTLPREYR